jgi:hypothetical protein
MATVSRKFRDDFDAWAAARIECGDWTPDEITELKDMLRRDLSPGPDQLREGLSMISATGIEVPATIDDHEERYRLWAAYFHEATIRYLTATSY